MTDLTVRALVREAPGAAPVRNASQNGLISTAAFLRFVERAYGMTAVLAVQGKGHIDASRQSPATMGRHFVIAARSQGAITEAFFLLNSHQKHRRVHIGFGLWNKERESFLIGPSMTIQRWKGFKDAAIALHAEWHGKMGDYTQKLLSYDWSSMETKQFGMYMSRRGYTDFIESHPSGVALVDGLVGSPMLTALNVVNRMRKGNLKSSERGRRNIKGIHRPDGLFHAGLAAMHYIVSDAINNARLPASYELPRLAERLPRP